jgi:hypothetical protein
LIGIGAAKCGTSALHAYLADHPEIEVPARKELKHFGGPTWLEQLPQYARSFAGEMGVRAETSPTYAMDPFVPSVPEQIAATLPDPRFLYVLGDPVRRVVSHWGESRALTFERRSLREALADAEDPLNPYVAASRYAHQLERFQTVFGAERVLVIDQDDLRARRRETLREIYTFAGVDPDYWSPRLEVDANVAADKVRPNRLGRWVLDRTRGSQAGRRWAMIPHLTATSVERTSIEPDIRARLETCLRPEAERLRTMTGRSFASWSI